MSSKISRTFKDWTMPGPAPWGDPGDTSFHPEPGETFDALSGLWRIYQYERGHRYSTDDVLTAWYGTTKCPSASRVLDLGSGIGSVAMMTAWRLPGARFVTIEAQEISTRLARKSVRYNGIEERFQVFDGDFRDPERLREEPAFDLVLGSPPYFPLGTGVEGEHPQTIPCRFEVRGDIVDYAQAAARHLGPGGVFACVFPSARVERVEHAAHLAELSIISRRDVVFREGEPPLVSLFALARMRDLPPSFAGQTLLEPPLTIRLTDGQTGHEYKTIKFTMGFRP